MVSIEESAIGRASRWRTSIQSTTRAEGKNLYTVLFDALVELVIEILNEPKTGRSQDGRFDFRPDIERRLSCCDNGLVSCPN